MFVEDIKNDFYNILLGNRVLLLVHYDVDAICACRILQNLFKSDNISYTLVPVGGVAELKKAYEENCEEIKFVVLVNCGGTIDLVDILQPEEDVVFFVLDAHKPTDVCNVYSDGQVRLVYKDNEENIPNFDDIFRDDEDEENEESVSGREGMEALVEKRREKRAWEERRNTLMFNYTQFSYYGKPSACILLDLSWRLSRVSVTSVWAAAVACASQLEFSCRTPAACLLDADVLATQHVNSLQDPHCRVVLERDVSAPLYRVWSLGNALRHSPTIGPQLKLHSRAGEQRLRQLLLDMGVPLQQACQAYRSMDVELRRSLLTSIESVADRHKLTNVANTTFLLHRTHAPTLAATDIVYEIIALIEHETIPKAEGFQLALSALDTAPGENNARNLGANSAKRTLTAVASAVHSSLQSKQVHLAGPFAYFILQEGTPEAGAIKGPLWLTLAARYCSACGGGARPVLAARPAGASTLLAGLPPRYHTEPRNLFGAAFEQAARGSGVSASLDFMDTSIITLPTSQRANFLDALTALLA